MSGIMPSHQAKIAGKAALRRVEQFRESTNLETPVHRGDVEDICWRDLNIGRLLDKGTFSHVYEATLHRDPVHPARPRYAVKCLKQNVTKQQYSLIVTGAVDLALEAEILAKLMHPNIIRLHASTAGCNPESFRYFLLLDLLVDTLDKRLTRWRREERKSSRFFFSIHTPNASEKRQRQLDRLEHVALGVAEGLAYLHSRNVLYRDLKTQNIGFDKDGVVRIFDFGFAREVDNDGNLRHQTGNAGTPRYMAPEVARNEPFSFASDVYSFSILLWEVLTLGKPFESIKSIPQFIEEVARGKLRPPLKKVTFLELKTLLKQSWDDDQTKRPDFPTIRQTIQQCLVSAAMEEGLRRTSRCFSRSKSCLTDYGDSSTTTAAITSRDLTTTFSERLVSRFGSSRQNVADAPVRQSWFQRILLRQSSLDLSFGSSPNIQQYDLGRRDSFSNSSQSSNASGMRGHSAMSERGKAAMTDVLAAEAKSNKQVL